MRIISKHRDYYDGVQGYGFDTTPTYVRTQEVVEATDVPELVHRAYTQLPGWSIREWQLPEITRGILVFCGKLYPVLMMGDTSLKNIKKATQEAKKKVESSVHATRWQKRRLKSMLDDLLTGKAIIHGQWAFNSAGIKLCFESFPREFGPELHVRLQCPVILYRRVPDYPRRRDMEFALNPCLKDLGFPKWMDPFTAYQELDMYLGNQLAQQQERGPTGSDEIIRDSKGFDDKSFKTTSPGKKRKGRKRGRRN